MKYSADIIEHVPLPLQVRYVFSCAPINRRIPFVCAMLLKVGIDVLRSSYSLMIDLVCPTVQSKRANVNGMAFERD